MEEIDRALALAVLARTVRQGLRRPAKGVTRTFSTEDRGALRQAAAVLEPEGALADAVERLLATPAESPDVLDQQHARLFGHSLRGRVCPYETEYGGDAPFRQSQDLADISGYYIAFGLEPGGSGGIERLDHAACEFEYFEFLCTKEAWAIQAGDAEMLEVTRKAACDFLGSHLGRFGVAFGATLSREDPEGFYGRLGDLCAALLKTECGRLGLRVGPEFMEMRSTEDDGVPMACGSDSCPTAEPGEPDLVQIQSRGEAD